ncbi:MAG TPA: hypothetical protein VN837_19360 [Chloroflexota bacterium]|nr:hypothetical protein [Chloroflexota bacterium]
MDEDTQVPIREGHRNQTNKCPPAGSRRPFKHGAHSPTDTFKYLITLRILGAIHLVEVREEFSLVGSRKRRLDDPAAWQERGISVASTPRPIMLAGG